MVNHISITQLFTYFEIGLINAKLMLNSNNNVPGVCLLFNN